jgi:hypothetical protein
MQCIITRSPLSNLQLYLAVAIPLEDASYDVSLSWNFEANYQLPSNYTELILPFVLSGAVRSDRQFNRRSAYEIVERRFERFVTRDLHAIFIFTTLSSLKGFTYYMTQNKVSRNTNRPSIKYFTR